MHVIVCVRKYSHSLTKFDFIAAHLKEFVLAIVHGHVATLLQKVSFIPLTVCPTILDDTSKSNELTKVFFLNNKVKPDPASAKNTQHGV